MGRRRRRGHPIHGWLNIDKPVAMSSAACVDAVRRATEANKLGQAGTLDPLASGVLPIALGEATKTMPYFADAQKQYRFTVIWGESRTTDDAEGEVTATSDVRPDAAAVAAVLDEFVGEIEQVPPAYSAIKVGGKRAYALARAGLPVELAARTVRVDALSIIDAPDAGSIVLSVACGKGTYMRALARDLAHRLGTCAYLADLRRTAVGSFTEEASILLEKLEQVGHIAAARDFLLPIDAALDGIPALALSERDALKLRSGQAVAMLRTEDRERIAAIGKDGIVLARDASQPIALARVDGMQIRPVRVLNL